MNAASTAAAQRLENTLRSATLTLNDAYAQTQTAHQVAMVHQQQVLPMRQQIAAESLLRYNAMQIGVFELIADARDQVLAVQAAIAAQERYWLADAALQAQIMGRPANGPSGSMAGLTSGNAALPAAH